MRLKSLFSLVALFAFSFIAPNASAVNEVQKTDFVVADEIADSIVDEEQVAIDMTPEEIAAAEAAEAAAEKAQNGTDPGAVIIGHVTDAHSWHLFDFEGRNGKEHAVAISLPIILINDGHLDIFMSKRFEHGHADYKGYRLIGGGLEKEQIICVDEAGNPILDSEGNNVKPIDLSLTKTSAAIVIVVILLISIILYCARQYKKRGTAAPHGFQSIMELLILHVKDGIVAPMLGKHTDKYLPYLLTLFFFIFFCNILGLIPFFPAGANITGCIAVTCILAFITFFITNLNGTKHYWKDIFNTPGVPAWLKIFPLMPLVEVVGMFTKPIVLMIRLFANVTAGHIIILGFVTIIFILSNSYGMAVGGAVSVFSILFAVFISALECLVAYIQAFVFTMLSALYISMAVEEPEEA